MVAVVLVVTPGLAAAHVTVHPNHLPAGATDVELTFRCPNERNDATVTELRVFLPVRTPLLGVLTDPAPGWSAVATTTRLARPVRTDDGEVTSAVTEVAWRATGSGTPPGQYADFTIAVGTMPDTVGTIAFKALQTYSNGDVAAWIQIADALDEDPPMPAPVLTLTAASPPSSPASPGSSSTSTYLAIAALCVALVALGGVGYLLVRRRPS
ncbi:MAG TPA: YcnI family protein [Acidimicrobiales bacterium]|nr:YcnI family protein [Acidimicrobiales bacterium]